MKKLKNLKIDYELRGTPIVRIEQLIAELTTESTIQISTVLKVIQNLSLQKNLLSFNAMSKYHD